MFPRACRARNWGGLTSLSRNRKVYRDRLSKSGGWRACWGVGVGSIKVRSRTEAVRGAGPSQDELITSDRILVALTRVTRGVPSRSGALVYRSAASFDPLDCRWHVGLVEGARLGARRDDLVDPIEDVVAEHDVHAGEQVVELLHGANFRAVRW